MTAGRLSSKGSLNYFNPLDPLSLLLTSVHSLENQLDYPRLHQTARTEARTWCVFIFNQTWLYGIRDRHPATGRTPFTCIQIQIKSLIALERDLASSPYRSTATLGETCKSTLWTMSREAATGTAAWRNVRGKNKEVHQRHNCSLPEVRTLHRAKCAVLQ